MAVTIFRKYSCDRWLHNNFDKSSVHFCHFSTYIVISWPSEVNLSIEFYLFTPVDIFRYSMSHSKVSIRGFVIEKTSRASYRVQCCTSVVTVVAEVCVVTRLILRSAVSQFIAKSCYKQFRKA